MTLSIRFAGRLFVLSLLAAAVVFWAGPAHAVSAAWTGGSTDALWSNGANWDATPVPGTGDIATFSAAAGVGGAVINLTGGVTVNTILFDTANAAAYTIGSGTVGSQTLTLDNGGAITINSAVANNQLFNANTVLGTDGTTQSFTITNNSTAKLTVAGGITGSTGSGVKNLTVTGAGNTSLSGIIGNGATGTVALTKAGGGTLTLSGANIYTGATLVSGGTLKAVGAGSLGGGASDVTLSGGDLSLASDGAGTGLGNGKPESINYGNAVTLTASRAITVGQSTAAAYGTFFNAQNKTLQLGTLSIGNQTLTVNNNNGFGLEFTGATTLTAATPTFNVGGGSNAPVVQGLKLSGKVTGVFGINKSGGGTLVLSNAANDFGSASTISITGGLVSVASDAALGNSGNIISLSNGGLQADGTFSTARQINTAGTGVIDVTQGAVAGSLNMLTLTTAFNGGAASGNQVQKNGNGILALNIDNNNGGAGDWWTGQMYINAGAVRVQNAGALGSSVTGNTVVALNQNSGIVGSGAAVQLDNAGGMSIAEPFNISSTGLNTGGAIENVSGANDLTGLITLGAAATIGSTGGTLNINGGIAAAGNALTFVGAGDITVGATAITGTTGAQTKIGSGRATISVADPLTGNITVNAGELALVSTATTTGTTAGNLTVTPGATLTVDNAVASFDDRLGGNAKTIALGGATLNFTGNGTTSEALGALTVNAGLSTINTSTSGTLSFTNLAARNIGGVVKIASGGTSSVQFMTTAPTLTPAAGGILAGFFVGNDFATVSGTATAVAAFSSYVAGDLIAAGATDTVKPSGPQSNVNTMTVNALNLTGGVGVAINPGQTLTLGAGGLINDGGGSIAGGSLTTAGNAELIANYATSGSISSIISGTTGGLTKLGAGNLTLSSRMTYTGQTTIDEGTLTLGAGNHTLAVSQPLVVNNGGTLDLGVNSQYVGTLSSTGTVQGSGGIITGAGGTLTVNQTSDQTFAGSIQGSVNLIKTGGRTLTLTNANTTTGTISMIGGLGSVRERNNTSDIGNGVTLRDGGTLLNTAGIVVRNATLNIDNTGTKDIADRVKDTAPITLDNGTIRFVGRSQTNSTETLGAVTASGFSAITMVSGGNTQGSAGVNSATLTLTSLTRNSGAIIHFNRGVGVNTPLGQLGNNPRVLLKDDNTSGLTFCNDTLVGMYSNNDNDKMMPVSYVPGLGFGRMGTPGFPNHFMASANGNGFTGANTLASAGPTNDFITGDSQLVKLGGQTINSLGIQGNNSTLLNFQAPGDTLTLDSGYLALWFRKNILGDAATNRGAITSGQSELFLFGDYLAALGGDNVNTIHSVIKNNGANPVKFVMGLARDTYLTANNTYTGGTVVNDLVARENGGSGYFGGVLATLYLNGTDPGYLTIPNATNPADGLVMNSSNVTMQGNEGQIGSSNIVTLNGSSVLTLVGNNTLAGIIFNSNGSNRNGTIPAVNPGGTLTLTGGISSTPSNAAVTPTISGGALDFAGATRNVTVAALTGGGDFAGYAGLNIAAPIQNGGLTKLGAGVLQLSGASTYTGTTTVSGGTLSLTGSLTGSNVVVNGAGAAFNESATGTINGLSKTFTLSSGAATLAGANTYTGLTTVQAGTLKLVGTTATPNAWAPVLTGGGSDIQGGKMTFDYTTDGITPASTIQGLLTTSYAAGAWNTGQFKNTTQDASHGLGWIDDTGSKQVKVAYTFYGDATLDGSVDATDLAKVLANYNQLSGMVWGQGDFDYNATVDATDLAKVLANYNQGPIVPGITAVGLDAQAVQMLTAAGFTVVPEPSTLALLAAGLLGLLAYAWRRRRS